MTYVPNAPAGSKFLNMLRSICEGKIYLEVEFARLTKIAAKALEDGGDVNAASGILQEVQVETYGSMEKDEKLEFLLDQLRLLILQGDTIRFFIVSKKVNRKILDEEQFLGQKITFFQYLAQYYDSEEDFFEVAKAYRTLYQATNDAAHLQ
jgi:26S proteasome regulatory subunit N5